MRFIPPTQPARAALLAGLSLAAVGMWSMAAMAAARIPDYISAAVASSDRPSADRDRDALRKPAEALAFAGIRPGDRVGELIPGGGYFTQLFCRVVGEQGHVYAVNITPVMPMPMRRPPAAPVQPPEKPCMNITTDDQPVATFVLPARLDVVWTSQNYHDLHNKLFGPADMRALNKAIYTALKPGGIYIIEDHAAVGGSGARDTETLHRIDPALVKKEVTSVGFVLVAQSDLLRNRDDPRTGRIFDMHDKTDKFLFKFRKPDR